MAARLMRNQNDNLPVRGTNQTFENEVVGAETVSKAYTTISHALISICCPLTLRDQHWDEGIMWRNSKQGSLRKG